MAKGVVLEGVTARELAWRSAGKSSEGWTVVENEEIEHRRWESVHRLVIRNEEGEHYAATYRRGLTENQDGRPFDDEETVTFTQVFPKTETVEVVRYV
jgi:hypothetical protein